jgi:hypothetical protein
MPITRTMFPNASRHVGCRASGDAAQRRWSVHMGTSSLLGTHSVPVIPAGSDSDALGPSDSSDSGSDLIGADPADIADAGELPAEGADISVDRVVGPPGAEDEAQGDRDDEDPDLSFMDEAEAGDPLEDEGADAGDDPTDNEMAAPRPPPVKARKSPKSPGSPKRTKG